jgi:acetyl esterase/lipase
MCRRVPFRAVSSRLFRAGLMLTASLLLVPAARAEDNKARSMATTTGQSVVVPSGVVYVPDQVYGKPDARTELQLDLARPAKGTGPFPAVVCIPGGGFLMSDRKPSVPTILKLAEHGYLAVCINYRTATESVYPAQVQDVKCAVRWLQANAEKYQIDPQRIAALGFSAGGNLACMVGSLNGKEFEGNGGHAEQSSEVRAVVGYYAMLDLNRLQDSCQRGELPWLQGAALSTSLQTFVGGQAKELGDRLRKASPIQHVSGNTPPTLLLHGTADRVMPVDQSQRYEERLKKVGVEARLVLVPQAPHNFEVFHNDQALQELLGFLGRHLKRDEATAVRPVRIDRSSR